jgi:hypothetical protein
MLAVPTFAYEVSTFLSGLLSVQEMGANSILINFNAVMFMGSLFGLSIAGCIRIGHVIGAGLPNEKIAYSCKVMIYFITGVMVVVALVSIVLRRQVGYMFTGDEKIIAIIEDVVPVQSLLLVVNAPALAYQAILLALGKQTLSFWINVLGFWLVGLPVGAAMTFLLDMGVAGLWWGIIAGMVVMSTVNKIYVDAIDFDNLEEHEHADAVATPEETQRLKGSSSGPSDLEQDVGGDLGSRREGQDVHYMAPLQTESSGLLSASGPNNKSLSSLVVLDQDSLSIASPVGEVYQVKRQRKPSIIDDSPPKGTKGSRGHRSGSYGSTPQEP